MNLAEMYTGPLAFLKEINTNMSVTSEESQATTILTQSVCQKSLSLQNDIHDTYHFD